MLAGSMGEAYSARTSSPRARGAWASKGYEGFGRSSTVTGFRRKGFPWDRNGLTDEGLLGGEIAASVAGERLRSDGVAAGREPEVHEAVHARPCGNRLGRGTL